MGPAAVPEDPLTQYLLGVALVVLVVGSVGGLAQVLHTSGLPSLAYAATVLVPVLALVALAWASDRRAGDPEADTGQSPPEATGETLTEERDVPGDGQAPEGPEPDSE